MPRATGAANAVWVISSTPRLLTPWQPTKYDSAAVSRGPVAEKYRAEYTDQQTGLSQYVYVCCEGCLNEFTKNADAFVAKMSKEEREAIKANTTCPVSGEAVSKDKFVEFEGRKVYFCCDGCKDKYKKDHPGAK